MNNGNIKGKYTLSETIKQSDMARNKLNIGKDEHKYDGSKDPSMKCDVLQYHYCTNVTVNDGVEIIDTKVIDSTPVDADKCKHCLKTGKWQTIIRANCCHIPMEFLLDSGASLNVLSSQFIAKLLSKWLTIFQEKTSLLKGLLVKKLRLNAKYDSVLMAQSSQTTFVLYQLITTFWVILSLQKNKAIINFDMTEVTLKGSKLPMYAPSTRSTTVKTVICLWQHFLYRK